MQVKDSDRMWRFTVLFAVSSLLLTACASGQGNRPLPHGNYASSVQNIPYAAATPLRDFNLMKPRTSARLQALRNPYGTDTHVSCAAILNEARQIQYALQRNQTRHPGNLHKYDSRAGYIGNTADIATQTAATSFVPFRGLIRQISGASKRDQRIRDAEFRGRERLGFLIGVGSANHCPGFNVPSRQLY